MKKIIRFPDTRECQKKTEQLRPAFPTKQEVECFRNAVDAYKRATGGQPLPLWMVDGRELRSIWECTIVPIAEAENVDPWDIAGVFFANIHGMDFIYEDNIPVKVVYNPEEVE